MGSDHAPLTELPSPHGGILQYAIDLATAAGIVSVDRI